ncbi:3-dehydroquinate synthase [Streptococcus uberis]|nr:3-dehydroquinate synthase [Streptococcus uberis]
MGDTTLNKDIEVHSRLQNYSVIFSKDVIGTLNSKICDISKIRLLVLTDRNVYFHQRQLFLNLENKFNCFTHIIEPGGNSKSLTKVQKLYDILIENNFNKGDILLAIGGGVVGDLGGFTAATFNRGMRFIQVPTTLLSQVDSSIGGKVGIHYNELTNMIGAIYPPEFTIVNLKFLDTLPQREFCCGMSEIIKMAYIYNASLLNVLTKAENISEKMEYIISKSIEIKKDVIENDEFENHKRLSLNFGHTLGHAIETLYGHLDYLHGEAVAIGMVFEAKLSLDEGKLSKSKYNKLLVALKKHSLPTFINLNDDSMARIAEIIKTDKKNSSDQIHFILPTEQGFSIYKIKKNSEKIINDLRKYLVEK